MIVEVYVIFQTSVYHLLCNIIYLFGLNKHYYHWVYYYHLNQHVDLNDNNIPNGNSVYLTQINKLYYITNDKHWSEKSRILQQSFHQVLNSNFSQMFSFVKALDMYHETISFTFYGDNKEIKNYLLKNYFDRAIFIYDTENKSDSGVVICKNQTCSNKISSINEINDYLKGISN